MSNTIKYGRVTAAPPAGFTDVEDEPTMPRGPRPIPKALQDSKPPDQLRLRLPDGRRYVLSRPMSVGRAHDNDVVVHDPCVSRYHCRIAVMADKAFVERLTDKPMWLNQIECAGGWLGEGASLRIGKTELWIVPAGNPSSLRNRRR